MSLLILFTFFYLFTIFFFSRVVAKTGKTTEVSGQKFLNFGSHSDSYPCNYLTAAAAIGMTKNDVDLFITRLDQVLKKSKKTNIPKPLDTESDGFGPFTSETGEEASDLSTIIANVKCVPSAKPHDSTITATAKSDSSAKSHSTISATAQDSTASSATAATAMSHSTTDTGDDDILKLGTDISSLKKAMGISHDKKSMKKEMIGGSGSGSKHNSDDDDLLVV